MYLKERKVIRSRINQDFEIKMALISISNVLKLLIECQNIKSLHLYSDNCLKFMLQYSEYTDDS